MGNGLSSATYSVHQWAFRNAEQGHYITHGVFRIDPATRRRLALGHRFEAVSPSPTQRGRTAGLTARIHYHSWREQVRGQNINIRNEVLPDWSVREMIKSGNRQISYTARTAPKIFRNQKEVFQGRKLVSDVTASTRLTGAYVRMGNLGATRANRARLAVAKGIVYAHANPGKTFALGAAGAAVGLQARSIHKNRRKPRTRRDSKGRYAGSY
jgi:hypothetical protein